MSRIRTGAGSASLRQGRGDAVLRRLVRHGLWPSLHMCAPWGPALCLWWNRSSWGMMLRLPASEVAACWDLDSSRCKGVKWVLCQAENNCFLLLIFPAPTDERCKTEIVYDLGIMWNFRVCLAFRKERNNTDTDSYKKKKIHTYFCTPIKMTTCLRNHFFNSLALTVGCARGRKPPRHPVAKSKYFDRPLLAGCIIDWHVWLTPAFWWFEWCHMNNKSHQIVISSVMT